MQVYVNVHTNTNMLGYSHIMTVVIIPNEMLNLVMMPAQYLIFV